MKKHLCIFALAFSILLSIAGAAAAAQIYIPAMKGKPGNTVEVPIIIDQVEQLAGIKIIVRYDKEVLTFKEGSKTKNTQSLMHIINDKQPGRLIIVMAGAKGIGGKDLTVMTLTFSIKTGVTAGKASRLEIPEIQLMSESLVEIKADVRSGSITIVP